MCKVVIQITETVSTRKATKRLVKIFDSTYAKSDLEQVAANVTQRDFEDRTQLLGILKDFEDLFDGALVYWYTDPVDLELKPDSKPFN